MGLATNLLIIILGINLMLFIFGNPENNSPMLAIVKAIFTGDVDWLYLFQTIGSNLLVYGTLMGIITAAAFVTGGNPLTGGGGYGSAVAMQIIAIATFSALVLFPNFSTFGFPTLVEYILNIVFGGLVTVATIGLLRGVE